MMYSALNNAFNHPVQLSLKRGAGGVPLGHAGGKGRYRIPELSSHPLELGVVGLLQKRGNGQRGLDG